MQIYAQELNEEIHQGKQLFILDVREPYEYENWHIEGSTNIPLSRLNSNVDSIPKDKQIIVVCSHGMRSEYARRVLDSMGYDAKTLTGGMVAWNSVYNIAEIDGNEITVLQFQRLGKGCLSYMVINQSEAIVIDPAIDIDIYINEMRKRDVAIVAVLDTHTHADHVSGAKKLTQYVDCNYFSSDAKLRHEHVLVEDRTEINFGKSTLKAVSTPGHTPESVMYKIDNIAFTGDTLFVESIGRPDLGQDPISNGTLLWETLNNIFLGMPEDTKILPAHYGKDLLEVKSRPVVASLGELRSNLKAFRLNQIEFVEWISKNAMPKPQNYDVIKKINLGEELFFDDEEIHEIEAGPNRCAVD